MSGMRATSVVLLSSLVLGACGGGGEAPQPAQGGSQVPNEADLIVDVLVPDSLQLEAGGSVGVQDRVRNAGALAAAASQLAVYLSQDAALDAGDVLLGMRSVSALAGGETSSAQGALTIPAATPAGAYRLIALADAEEDVPEFDEANNLRVSSAVLQVGSGTLSNLVPTQLSASPSSLDAGDALSIADAVRNDGDGAAGTFQVGVYLSTDAVITPGDILIGLRSVEGLAPGALSFGDDELTVPGSTPEGAYHVGALVDVGGTQPESNEFDNAIVASGTVFVHRPPRPDLLPTTVAIGQTAIEAGQSLTVQDAITNIGVLDAGPFRVGVFVSEDAEITTDDVLIGERTVAGLAVGAVSTAQGAYTVSADIGAGTRYVGLVVDHDAALLEEDETNNVLLAAGTVEVSIPPLPDLRPTALSFSPSVLEEGETLTVVERVVNEGTAPAGAFRVGVYLSSNPVIAPTDVLVGSRVVDGLGIGSADEAQSQYTLPPGVSAGSWYVGVIADDLGALAELQDGDNALLAPGLVDVTAAPDPMPDLVIEAVSTPASQVLSGGTLQVLHTVRNEGTLSSAGFQVGIYLSTDNVITTEDTLIGQRTVFSLGVGFGSAQSFPYTVPTSLPVGDYWLGALADHQHAIAELDEDNNGRAASGRVEVYVPPPPAPDLVVASLSVGVTTVAPGGTLSIDDVVRNDGELASGSARVAFYLSADEDVDETDVLIGVRTLPGLAAEGDSSGSTSLTLPLDLEPGTWTLAAFVDDLDAVEESDEENNWKTLSSTLEVQP